MIRINESYTRLKPSYLFADVAKRVQAFQAEHPEKKVIRMGIGDVVKPLPRACIAAFHKAVDEMGTREGFHGYGPEKGYEFLRHAIYTHDFASRGITTVTSDDIFVSDGSKCDVGNIQELFSSALLIGITDPVYPVYVDSNVMAGRTGEFTEGRYTGIHYLECTKENDFLPSLPDMPVDLIYLCSPNNPTGAVLSKAALTEWVQYARQHQALIIFDAAYAEFLQDESVPKSIFEIPRAEECALEMRSFSKTAGFTGTRCAYTIIPESCTAWDESGNPYQVKKLWSRRQSTKFNGVSYPVQRAAEAAFSPEGEAEAKTFIRYYLENAALIRSFFERKGFYCSGGMHAPYIWIDAQRDSWELFDVLLREAAVVCTPGAGFGKCGEGFIRLSAFQERELIEEALDRIRL